MKKILLQLDCDDQASVFDSVVAGDAGVDHLFRHQGVTPATVTGLVHGCIFTRGGKDLANTAIFVGGSDVQAGEAIARAVKNSFFGPMQVSVMMDANGCNTTAAAAVIASARHVDLNDAVVTVLAGTGPVGQRIAKLCLRQGATVRLCSRKLEKAEEVCAEMTCESGKLSAVQSADDVEAGQAVSGTSVVFAAGAAGIELLSNETRQAAASAKVLIDLNAVPPLGIGGVEMFDKAVERDGQVCYGAIGVGGTKMKIHKAVMRSLFETNDRFFDAEEIFDLGMELETS